MINQDVLIEEHNVFCAYFSPATVTNNVQYTKLKSIRSCMDAAAYYKQMSAIIWQPSSWKMIYVPQQTTPAVLSHLR